MKQDFLFDKIPALLHGGDYNPDQWVKYPEILQKDVELMKEAHINCVSMGIFAWSMLEPEEGQYQFDWLASGSRTLILPIEGIDNPAIIHGSDLLDGKRAAGKKVLVVGGGMVGCETAAFLGEQNHDVTVIEFRDTVGADVIHEHRVYLMKDFEDYKIKEITGAKVCKFYEDGVEYETADGQRHESRGYDSVILSMGFRNYNPFGEEIKAIVPDTYVIGDATRARRALDATKEAYEVASTL